MGFSKDFFWGGATAANQYEGGVFEGGAGLSTFPDHSWSAAAGVRGIW